MFGSVPPQFWKAYYEKMPQARKNWDERHELYQLYHYMNHWYVHLHTCLSQCIRLIWMSIGYRYIFGGMYGSQAEAIAGKLADFAKR